MKHSRSDGTPRGWRFFAAQFIYYLGISLLIASAVGLIGIVVWMFATWIDPVGLMVTGMLFGGFAAVVCFGALWDWATEYLREYREGN